jgi:hypothetical protein
MQQRRLRLGDTVDDYCPRERRVTNHAIAAMVDDQITHTRCTACEADHEYKEARVPRRKREDAPPAPLPGGRIVPHTAPEEEAAVLAALESVSVNIVVEDVAADEGNGPDDADNAGNRDDDNAPVHRRLIRATFPRPEGQPPEWKEPEFTSRQPSHQRRGRFGHGGGQGEPNGNRAGHPRRGGGRGPFSGGGQPRGDGNRSGGHWQGGGGRHGGGGQGQPDQGGQGEGGGGRSRRRRGR